MGGAGGGGDDGKPGGGGGIGGHGGTLGESAPRVVTVPPLSPGNVPPVAAKGSYRE